MGGEIETLEERVVFRNKYITVWDDAVRFPSGEEGTYVRWQWNAPHGVAIVPIIGDDVLLIRTYRYQEQSFAVEVPQGFGTENSSPEEDARRELLEETGLSAEALEPLMVLGGPVKTHVFAARFPEGALADHSGVEKTESIVEFLRCPVADINPQTLARLDIRGALTSAALLGLKTVSER